MPDSLLRPDIAEQTTQHCESEEKIMLRHFTLEYWVEDGWHVGRLKEVPGVFSQGESLEELEENIREAYQLMMEDEEVVPTAEIKTKEIGVDV